MGVQRVIPIAVAVAAVSIAGCGPKLTQVETSHFLIPVTIGNQWTYFSTDSIRGTGVTPLASAESTFTQTIVRDTVDANSVNWAVFETRLAPTNSLIATTYETMTTTGMFRMTPATKSSIMLFPYPVVLDQIDTTAIILDGPVVLSLFDTLITVPAGSFHCLRYDYVTVPSTAVDPYQTVFIALGTGIILKTHRVAAAFDASGKLIGHQDHMQILMSTNAK